MPTPNRPSVFISYAHFDATDFIRRLAYALEFYMDVFWDRRLQAGEYPQQLEDEIKNRDFFIFVMTPYSLRFESWCQKEIKVAKDLTDSKKRIVLVKIYKDDYSVDKDLMDIYSCGDFTEDFDYGFRQITQMILRQPYSSWEYLYYEKSDEKLGDDLKLGYIPCLISKQLGTWVLIEKFWEIIKLDFKSPLFLYGNPRTAIGFKKTTFDLAEGVVRDASLARVIVDGIGKIIKFYDELNSLKETEHFHAGQLINSLIENIKAYFEDDFIARKQSNDVVYMRKFFYFDIYEKLRELIGYYANTSRKLY